MKWNIVADSSIDLFDLDCSNPDISFSTVPFTLTVGQNSFVDDESLDREQLLKEMKACKTASTSACPSTGAWMEQFEKEGNVFAITITSGLSGSYNSACAARNLLLERYPEKNIYVIDSLSVGAEMILTVRELCRLIHEGFSFSQIVEEIQRHMLRTHCVFALSSFDNLVKNGRMNKLAGFVANRLGLCGIGIASAKGTIEIKGIARGRKKALATVMEDLHHRGNTGISSVVICHCNNEPLSQELKALILQEWPEAQISIVPNRGLCSYYAEEGGLIVGYYA